MKKTFLSLCSFLLICTLMNCDDTAAGEISSTPESKLGTEASEVKTPAKNIPSFKNVPLPKWPLTRKTEKGKIPPFDEAPKDSTLTAFRQQLYNVVKARAVTPLLSMISPDFKFSFGDDNGIPSFIAFWELDKKPKTSEIWTHLEKTLELGGGFSPDNPNEFYAPYIFVSDVFEDPFNEAAIIGENVRMRDKPSLQGKVAGALSWNQVFLLPQDKPVEEAIAGEKHYWYKVKTQNGTIGYVYGKYVRSPIDYRLGFSKGEQGKWQLNFFIAGD